MVYDLGSTTVGLCDCSKCRHTMTRLKQHNAIERNEGYLLDEGNENNLVTYLLFGWIGLVLKFLYRHTLQPLTAKALGQQRQKRYDKILKEYPNSLICSYCSHILKQK